MPAPGAMLGMGVDDMEWGVMPARPDLGGKPEPGPVEGADCAGGYGFTAGYVCGCGVSGRPAGGLLTFILASGGGGGKKGEGIMRTISRAVHRELLTRRG